MTEFKEIGRIIINKSRHIVAQKVVEDEKVGTGIHFYNYVEGFPKNGVFVPVEKLDDFGELVNKVVASSPCTGCGRE